MFQDRRTYPRRKAMLSFKVLFGGAELSCVTTDISPSGSFFAARDCPPIGSKVGIIIRPTGMKIAPVRIEAEVVRVNPLGGGLQPGFGVHFLSAHCESGGASIYHVLRQVLRLAEIKPDDLPTAGVVTFHFAAVGERIDLRSARRKSGTPQVPSSERGNRLQGRPRKPIQDAVPRSRRGSRVRPPPRSVAAEASTSRRHSSTATRRPSSHTSKRHGGSFEAQSTDEQRRESTQRGLARPTGRARATPTHVQREPAIETTEPIAAHGRARRITAEQKNAFADARLAPSSGDSGIFSPPGGRREPAAMPTFAPVFQPASPMAEPAPAAPVAPPAAPVAPPAMPPSAAQSSRGQASFSLDQPDESGIFTGKRPETSRIVAPFANQNQTSTRRRSDSSAWSVYESGGHKRVSARRRSDVVIQDDPFATGARKVAARFRQKEQDSRDQRREEREREREQLRAKLQARRRDSAPLSAAFSAETAHEERSMIFARTGQASTIGGPMLTGMNASPALPPDTTVTVQIPVTYELDGRFIPGTVISAAPLALEVFSLERVPQLDQKLVVNFPVHEGGQWQTVFLRGKLLRVPEARQDGQSFVLHIERVQECEALRGAYARFLTSAATDHKAGPGPLSSGPPRS